MGAFVLFIGLIFLILILVSAPAQNSSEQFQIQNQPVPNTNQPLAPQPQINYGPQGTVTTIDCAVVANAVIYSQSHRNQPPVVMQGVTQDDIQNCLFYQQNYCNKIKSDNIEVLKAVSQATKNDAGAYSLDQVIDSYKWTKENIHYLNVPLDEMAPRNPEDTIAIGSGDCKNMAILLASFVESIGGASRIIIVPQCTHAFAQVYIGDSNVDTQKLAISVASRYPGIQTETFTQKQDGKTWMALDAAGANYAGAVLPECQAATKEYIVTKC